MTDKRRGHGEGSVFYHQARGRWNVEIDYGYVGGRRKRTRRSFKSRKDATMWLTSAMKAKQDGIPIADGRTRLGDFLDNWLTSVIQPSKRAAATKVSYEAAIRLHIKPALGHHRLIDLRHQHVQAFINERRATGCGRSAMNTVMVVLRMALKQAIVEERITRNVAQAVSVPDPMAQRPAPRRLSEADRSDLLREVSADRLFGLYFVLATFGLLRGEAIGIRLEDVDITGKALHIRQQIVRETGRGLIAKPPKRGKARSLYLSDRSIDILQRRMTERNLEMAAAGNEWADSGLLFTTARGKAIDPSRINHHMEAACRRAGIQHAAPHSVRRGFADAAHSSGARDKDLQAAMGHGVLSQTMDGYVATKPGTDAVFAAIMDASLGDITRPLADTLADRDRQP